MLESTLVFVLFFGILEILGHLEEDYPNPLYALNNSRLEDYPDPFYTLNNSLQLLVDLTSFSRVGLDLYRIGRELLEFVTGLC